MTKTLFTAALLVLPALPALAQTGPPGDTLVGIRSVHTPVFAADTKQVPELGPWGHVAEALCRVWYERIVAILRSDDEYRPMTAVKIVFEKDMKGVAYASGNELHIAANWIKARPDDFGMVIHELTHLVQRYPSAKEGWLVEGIADYVRLKYFESSLPAPRINFEKANYTDAYKTTASFLMFVEGKYGAGLVPRLHAALRAGKRAEPLFKEFTGKETPALWEEFKASRLEAKPAGGEK